MGVSLDRSIFRTGEYVSYFQPDEQHNPFRRIYAQKRADVIRIVRAALGTSSTARVLDLGGGMGRIAVPLAEDYAVHLCDISEAMLALANETAQRAGGAAERLTTEVVDASRPLPFADDSFDAIVCLDLLVHLPDPAATVRELARVLKPGGTICIDSTNSLPFWMFFYPRYVGRRPQRWVQTWRAGGVPPEWAGIVRHFRRAQFLEMLRAAGLVVDAERGYGPRLCPKWHLAVAWRPVRGPQA